MTLAWNHLLKGSTLPNFHFFPKCLEQLSIWHSSIKWTLIAVHVFFSYKKLGFLSWESQNGQKVRKLAKKPETLIFFSTKNFILGTYVEVNVFVLVTFYYKNISSYWINLYQRRRSLNIISSYNVRVHSLSIGFGIHWKPL